MNLHKVTHKRCVHGRDVEVRALVYPKTAHSPSYVKTIIKGCMHCDGTTRGVVK